jgi:hypothetical protein
LRRYDEALHAAKQILREDFEVVATIDQLESQKNTFLEFFELPAGAYPRPLFGLT